jgi:flagellar assembly protein FliH
VRKKREAKQLSEAAVSYAFEPLEPSDPPARDAAARMVAQATQQAEQLREQARAEGYAEGCRAGHADGAAEVASAASALTEAAREIRSLRAHTVDTVESDAIDMALQLAEQILAGTLKAHPEIVVEVVRGALRRVSDRRNVAVLVNPADLDIVRGALEDLTGHGSGVELCDLQADERVGVGGAIVRTIEGEVDAGVYTQLERAREVIEHSLVSAEHAV